ncbi:MAG: 16S rRNA (guanine(527)-N(7))-methyltransferase RsmG [Thiomonas sp.]|nr:16S rRNA (guanine(527)-N(7))-methyltransferase RsmG [Thiomonas sp.]
MSTAPVHAATGFSLERFLQQTLDALGLALTAHQQRQLIEYTALLQRWNRVFNLTAVRDVEGMARLHLADCLAALPAFQRLAPRRLLDVGSGGGLPGIVLAIGLPETDIHLVDTVQKKCAFLQQTCGSLQLKQVQVHHARVEALTDPAGFDCITSRAFSDLPLLVNSTAHLLAPAGQWCAMKGRPPADEIAALGDAVLSRIEPLHVPGLDAQRCLVWLQRAAR